MPKRKQRRALDIGHVFAYRLRDTRRAKGWDQARLADEMTRRGFPAITRSAISKIEAGRFGAGGDYGEEPIRRGQTAPRQVSLAEAIGFAVALGVSPTSLILPLVADDDVALTANVVVDVPHAYAWARGHGPLASSTDAASDPDETKGEAFYRANSPEAYAPSGKAPPATLEDVKRMGFEIRLVPTTAKED